VRDYASGYEIQAQDRALAQEFRNHPFRPHSPDLLRLLNRLRGGSLNGKFVLFNSRRHCEWKLARLSGSLGPIIIYDGPVFQDRAEAEWAVFKLRWQQETQIDLGID
jgi:hypothetical protein